jgi:CheY-specific phosphatase CheX
MKEIMREVKETLRAAIFDVLEKMFYVFLEPVGDECSGYDMGAAIQFSGAQKGELKILASEGLARSMVQNLLGLKVEEITDKHIEDCIKEAANMICGNFLGRLDKTKVFDLTIPSFLRRPGEAVEGSNVCMLCFDSDGERFGAVLTLLN